MTNSIHLTFSDFLMSQQKKIFMILTQFFNDLKLKLKRFLIILEKKFEF